IPREAPDDQHQADCRHERIKSFVGTFAQPPDQCCARFAQGGERMNAEKENETDDQQCHHRLRINKTSQDIARLQLFGRVIVVLLSGLRGGRRGMRSSIYISVVFYAWTQLFGAIAFAQQLVLAPVDCLTEDPDSVQISWVEPCESGN